MKVLSRAAGVALLYTASLALASTVQADVAAAAALRTGDMQKLVFADPVPAPTVAFDTFDGGSVSLEEYRGKWVLLNFWATWCAPCRKEMPMLSDLQTELGGDDFEVVTVATGRNSPTGMKEFLSDIGVDNLPLHRDPKQKLAREMGVLGLPITVILDPDGQEIARMRGDADWSSENAYEILRTLIGSAAS